MSGPIVLLGSGEFTPAMRDLERDLLAATGRARPRVAIVPTACWPDGEDACRRWLEAGEAHFAGLGAEVECVELRGRDDALEGSCAQAIGEADFVCLAGGRADHLLDALLGTPAGEALRAVHVRGGVVAGCSAGAMVLAARQPRVGRCIVRLPIGWRESLALVEGVAVLPRYDAFPEVLAAALVLAAPRGTAVLGIDEETAAVGHGGSWQVRGRGRVTVWHGRRRTRYRAGDTFRLERSVGDPGPLDEGDELDGAGG